MGIREELRWTAAKLVDMGKFAVDSAVNESLKGSLLILILNLTYAVITVYFVAIFR